MQFFKINKNYNFLLHFSGINTISEMPDLCFDLPKTDKPESEALHSFIESISVDKPFAATIQIIRYVYSVLLRFHLYLSK